MTEAGGAPKAAGGTTASDTALYRLLVESVRDYAIFALDSTGHVLTWNPGAERFKGYTRDEIVGKHFSVFYPPEEAHRTTWELEVAARDGRYEEEGWRVRKDGTRFWANVVITALRDETGVLVGFAKVTRDLTERRKTEDLLRTSENLFELLVSSVRDYGIFMLDREGRISSWNEGAQRINGYTADEILGRHFSVFYPQEDVERGKPAWELEIATAEGKYEEEGWRVRRDGSRFWAGVLITALHNPGGELIGFAKVTRDLTERRESHQRAVEDARRIASAEASSRTKSEFLTSMSHELRTPLNAIGGYAELIDLGIRGPVTPEQREDLQRIQASQKHLLGLINEVLNYARIESGAIGYSLADVPVAEVVQAAEALVAPQFRSKGLTLGPTTCTPAQLTAYADREKVQQILLNLLSNAVKFTERGGRVEVRCDAADHRVRIRVSDTGIGIPTEKLEQIFEPFVQIGRALNRPTEGTGLGLAISRDLARGMGGDLSAESVLGEGSTITLTLPKGG
jgi:PAS domain S-box-containing protein